MYGPTLKHQAQFYKRLHNEQRVGNPQKGGGGGGGATAATKMTSEFGPSERITIQFNGKRYDNVADSVIRLNNGIYKLYARTVTLTIVNGVYNINTIQSVPEYSLNQEIEDNEIIDEIIFGITQAQSSQQKRLKSSAGGGSVNKSSAGGGSVNK
jgi:hypothetical protein